MTAEMSFVEESAKTIIKEINTFVRTSPLNRMPGNEEMKIFDKPLVRFADGDDPIFTEYKTIIAPVHMTPREVLAQVNEIQDLYKNNSDLNITIHGDGIAGWMYKHWLALQSFKEDFNESLNEVRVNKPDLDQYAAACAGRNELSRRA